MAAIHVTIPMTIPTISPSLKPCLSGFGYQGDVEFICIVSLGYGIIKIAQGMVLESSNRVAFREAGALILGLAEN